MIKEISLRNYKYLCDTVGEMTRKLFNNECEGNYRKDLFTLYQANTEFLNQLHSKGIITELQVNGMQENAFNIFCKYGEEF